MNIVILKLGLFVKEWVMPILRYAEFSLRRMHYRWKLNLDWTTPILRCTECGHVNRETRFTLFPVATYARCPECHQRVVRRECFIK